MPSAFEMHRIVAPTLLARGSAMSTVNQKFLGDLLNDISQGDRKLVIIAGAGVSMDAGLPSWNELISRLELELEIGVRNRLCLLGSTDLQRRAQQVFYHLSRGRRLHPDWNQLRSALYRDNRIQPGEMARALARLVACYRGDVKVLTTNFDGVMEAAYHDHGMAGTSYSMEGLSGASPASHTHEDWLALSPLNRSKSILHVHGMLSDDDAAQPYLPLILTETDFSAHGRGIRDAIADVLPDAIVILVGLSMTDPNVLGPLRKTQDSKGARYVVTVPDLFAQLPGSEEDPVKAREECAQYAVESSSMLATDLNVKPILLKSYGQIVQVLSDLSLAHLEPARYGARFRPAEQKLLYGSRFTKALSSTYKALGYHARLGTPTTQSSAEEVSRSLRAAAKRPLKLLNLWRHEYYHGQAASSEDFGFFLWLRDPCATRDNGSYKIRLIASSTYFHWDSWSGENVQEVSPLSVYTPALAVYHGKTIVRNVDSTRRRNWQGSMAVPLVQFGFGSMIAHNNFVLDRLTVGAISVNSTQPTVVEGARDPNQCSVLAHISNEQMRQLQLSMFEMAGQVVNSKR